MLELKGHATVGAHVAAVLGKRMAYFGDGTRLIVSQTIDHDRRSTNAVAFVADLDVIDAFQLTRALLDRIVDLVLGHIDRLGLVYGHAQAWIEARIAAAHLGRHGDFLGYLGEGRAALLILAAFAMLNIGPFGMSGHRFTSSGYGMRTSPRRYAGATIRDVNG